MNRSQLVNALAERLELSRREADAGVAALVDIITETVCSGEDVAISGFAKFRRVKRPARMGRNPATGAPVKIAAKTVVKITPLKVFKEAVLSGKAPKKAAAKKTAKKAPAKKAPAKKAAAKKAPAKKAPAKKTAAKKTVKKAPAKKTAKRR